MIAGIGIDMVEVERMGEKVLRKEFCERVFSPAEIGYCESTANKAEHYAARFAAKEAFLKATGQGLTAGYTLHDIEVVTDELGKPSLELKGNFLTLATTSHWNKIHLSLSHVRTLACAVVILEQ